MSCDVVVVRPRQASFLRSMWGLAVSARSQFLAFVLFQVSYLYFMSCVVSGGVSDLAMSVL